MNEKIFKILADTLGTDAAAMTEGTSMENTSEWDSVAHLNLVLSLEKAFGLRFTPDEFMAMRSVAEIKQVLAGHGVS
jgi:acyl carrier protein